MSTALPFVERGFPMISFSNVHVEKRGRTILRDINVDLVEKRVGVIGRNGSGKSTFARLFNRLEKPSSGAYGE